jgi:hypothetical protein
MAVPEKGDVLMNREDIIKPAPIAASSCNHIGLLIEHGTLSDFAAFVEAAARADERRKCATACYVKAYEINAMGDTEMHPAKAAELCAVAISQMP